MRKTRFALTVLAVAALLAGANASIAQAAESAPTATPDVYEILAANPGGTLLDERTISWQDGAIILTLDTGALARAVGSCATGSHCVYNGTSLSGSKLSFTSCGTTQSTAALPGTVRSIANARSSGTVQGQNSAGSTLTSVSANSSSASSPAGIVKVRCVS